MHGDPALIRRHLFALELLLLAGDGVLAAAVYLVARLIRFGEEEPSLWTALGLDQTVGIALYAAAWVTILWFMGMYEFRARWTLGSEVGGILGSTLVLGLAITSFLYLVKTDVSRLFLLLLLVIQPLATVGGRVALRLAFNWLRARGYNRSYMVVVGTGEHAQAFADAVERHRELGIEVSGHLRAPGEGDGALSRPVLGGGEDLVRVLHERVVDEVAVCVGPENVEWSEPLVRLATEEGKNVRVPARAQPAALDLGVEQLDDLLVRSYVAGPARLLSLAAKRAIDIAGAAAGLAVLSPVLALTALAILAREGRPVLFHQTRVGLHGRLFTLHKFRTMVPDAEERLGEVQHLNERTAIAFKAAADPRVTPLGRVLRRTSIDELPQLWNVLRGEMSLVGPRPPLPREVDQYDIWHRRRLSMKPGITGLWQVEARGDADFDGWVQRDLAYIDRWSLALDLRILAMTVPAVVARTGK